MDDSGMMKLAYSQLCLSRNQHLQVRDITHLFCRDTNYAVAGKCPCLLAGLSCIEICECTECQSTTQEAAMDEMAKVDDGTIQYEQSFLVDIGSTYTKEIIIIIIFIF